MEVLDLGCGPGTITAGIARLVAPGTVVGVDMESDVLERARTYALSQHITNVEFQQMNAYDLQFDDNRFDFAHAHQVLQHVSDPVGVLEEMIRVTKPGGWIAVRDADYSSFAWYPMDDRLDRWLELYMAMAEINGGEPDAGRYLLAWAHQAGLSEVVATSSTWTYTAGESALTWGKTWSDRILDSALTGQLIESGLASIDELRGISQAWLEWSRSPDAWFMVPSAEILAVVP